MGFRPYISHGYRFHYWAFTRARVAFPYRRFSEQLDNFLSMWFEVRTSFWDLLFHGLILFIALLVVNGVFVTVPALVFPGIATTLITLVVATFLDGFVAKKIAGWWQ